MLIQEACEEAGKKFFQEPEQKKEEPKSDVQQGEVAPNERTSSEEETSQEIYDQNSEYFYD